MLLLLLVGSGLTACWRQFQGKAAWEAARQESRQAYEASKEARAKAGAISNRARDAVKRAAGAAHESAKKAGDALEKAREAAQEAADAVRKIVDNAVLDAPELITAKATAKATEEARAAAEEAVSAAKSAQDRAAKIQADFNEREEGRQASNAAHATREASKRAKAHVEECETARTLNKVTVASEEATKCAQEANQAAGKVETLLEILVKEAQAQAEEGKRAARRAEKARDRARTKARETKKQLVAVLEAGKYRPKPDWHCWPWYIVERCRRWAAASAKGSTMTVSLDFMSNLPDQPGAWPEIELVVGGKRKKPEEWFKATLEAYLRTPLTLSTKDGNGNQIETKRKPLPPGREFRMLGVALGLDKARMALNGFSVDRVNEGMGTVGVFKFLNDTPLFSFKLLAGDELGAPGLQMTHHEDWKREPIVGNCWLHLLKKFREEVTVISLDGRPYSMLTRGSAEKCAEGFARFSKARWRAPLNPDDLMAEFGLEEAEDLFLEWTELLPEAKPVKKGEMEWRWRAESTPSLSGKLISCIAGLQGDIKKLKEGIEKLEESIPGRCNKAGFSLNKEQLHGKSKRVKEKLEEYLRAQIGEPPEKRGKLQEHRDEHLKQAREAWKNALGSDARDDVLKTTSSKRFRNSWPYPKELWQHKKDKDDNGRKEIDEAVEKCRKQQSAYRKCLVQIKACDICRERVTRDLDFYATQCGQLAKRRAEAAKLRSRPVKLTVTFGDYFTKEVEIAPSAEDTGE
ncbi:MAG: hypothetical protein HOJ57_43190 [Lentisphaerae bacterium]|nr:hypothetical protein [Lentisphaerota bacterium]MBT4820320.1 hypothetical protein [Lentisphaerota bacterium]MBT5612820.1 hypothetical protein [Lentisphaerota bacterium]MBT7056007.1 hypothetical protein [Lentisphaerota bacterium]